MSIPWENNVTWKVSTKDKKFYIMREHNWAFGAWEIAKLDGRIKEKSIVVHVDSHLDDTPDGALVNNLHEAKSHEEILRLSESYDRSKGITPESNIMQIDNFIWAALARGTIEEVIYVSRHDQEVITIEDLRNENDFESKFILSNLPDNCNYRHKRFYSIDEFTETFDEKKFMEHVNNRTVILDLDLDVFNHSDTGVDFPPLFKIRENINQLIALFPWDIITIAISPFYCGGVSEASLLLETVLEVFKIDLDETINW